MMKRHIFRKLLLQMYDISLLSTLSVSIVVYRIYNGFVHAIDVTKRIASTCRLLYKNRATTADYGGITQ